MYVLETYGYDTVRVAPADVSAPFEVRGNVCLRHKPELGLNDPRGVVRRSGTRSLPSGRTAGPTEGRSRRSISTPTESARATASSGQARIRTAKSSRTTSSARSLEPSPYVCVVCCVKRAHKLFLLTRDSTAQAIRGSRRARRPSLRTRKLPPAARAAPPPSLPARSCRDSAAGAGRY